MGVFKVPNLLCLLFLMLLVLAPGFDAKTCYKDSTTYTTNICSPDPCVEACHKEGFTDGTCVLFLPRPIIERCLCKTC
ncbi:hypothetical protein CFC21_110926 [Triticum aestivum]|uniref:Knottins-like domain-containing protein n=2 Tax=Triticum aestivum TaxID=4565 RepID=A0A9R1MPA8_WHEAT|nr:hypothetical protein CFC21_110926 [Triticum aestivum]